MVEWGWVTWSGGGADVGVTCPADNQDDGSPVTGPFKHSTRFGDQDEGVVVEDPPDLTGKGFQEDGGLYLRTVKSRDTPTKIKLS